MSLHTTVSIDKDSTNMTPRTRKTLATICRTTIKKKALNQVKKDRSPLAINFATNESMHSVKARSRASTARVNTTTKAVQDSQEGRNNTSQTSSIIADE